jgi:hypothetical protein
MKKIGQKTIAAGILIAIFGILVMAAAAVVGESILSSGTGSAAEPVKGFVEFAGSASWAILILSALLIGVGTLMISRSD